MEEKWRVYFFSLSIKKKASLIWPHDLGIISLDLTPYLAGTECSIFFYVFNFREAVGNQLGIMGDYNPW